RFEKTHDPGVACNVIYPCLLRDDALPDMGRLLPMTPVAAKAWHIGAWVLGAALYRAGKHEDALRCFENAARIYRPRAWDWSFRAMAHCRLGQAAEARHCLAEATRWIDEANARQDPDL